MAKQQFVFVAYKGTSTISLPAPGQGFSYVFQPLPVRNKVAAEVWAELEDERTPGAARPYLDKKVMRKTSAGDEGVDKIKPVKAIPIAKGQLPQAAQPGSNDGLLAQLQATAQRQGAQLEQLMSMNQRLEEQNRRLEAQLAANAEEKSQGPKSTDDGEADSDSGQASTGELDPGQFTAKTIKPALAGLTMNAIEEVKGRESAGKNRPAVLKVIEAALDEALMVEEQG
jgi:hypothetical protein